MNAEVAAQPTFDDLLVSLKKAQHKAAEADKALASAHAAVMKHVTESFGEPGHGTSHYNGETLVLDAVVPTYPKMKDAEIGEFRSALRDLGADDVVRPKWEYSKSAHNALVKKFGAETDGKENIEKLDKLVERYVKLDKGKAQLTVTDKPKPKKG